MSKLGEMCFDYGYAKIGDMWLYYCYAKIRREMFQLLLYQN